MGNKQPTTDRTDIDKEVVRAPKPKLYIPPHIYVTTRVYDQ